ncbi:hypothetical protein [Pyxidicoccus caerfyrddinensis]|uniref:hypothetical protein n=1 Tax=Pyxidicoccus caerfyrddinensis TaxID=2709663 RepID=UPI0013DB19A9|nr:hypothetical protein [Pyxidicoccus caerfyrddinensis]
MGAHPSDFGISPHNPIRVGGGILFGPFNERQYLARLRCRDGQPPEFERRGSFTPEGAVGPLDIYELPGKGLDGPIQLLFDVYTLPSSFEAPSGFVIDRPDEPLRLPISLVTNFRENGDAEPQQLPPRRWRILGAAGETLGFASWDGLTTVDIDLPKSTGELVRRHVDHFLAVAPVDQFKAVLEDFFERYLVLSSEGLVRGIPDDELEGPGEWTGHLWGDDVPAQPKRRKFWPWSRTEPFAADSGGASPRRITPWAERAGSVVAAAVLPLALVFGLTVLLRLSRHVQPDGPWAVLSHAALLLLGVYLTFRCGRAFVRLQSAPIYPRENFYGKADIAPEESGRHEVERRWLMSAGLLLLVADLILACTVTADQLVPALGLATGVLVEAVRAWRMLRPGHTPTLESELRGQYILYLRNFCKSRASVAFATLMAARPFKMVMIVSPRRIESRSVSWYVLATLRPRDFDRLRLWSTIDTEWDRVVASCMARSRGMVIDYTGVSSRMVGGNGLTLEMGISIGFAPEHPVAYAIDPDKPLPLLLPGPALLKVGLGLKWNLRYHSRLVQRLRGVLTRTLSEDENRYLAAHYAHFVQSFQSARIRDSNLAHRGDREDPHSILMKRRDELGR